MADKSKKTICLFNCDNTYKLEAVEAFLMEMNRKYGFDFVIGKHYFGLQQMADFCENTIPQIQMDCAIFVLHAGESRLSINEDNAGIGYAKLYKALLEATNNKVLIVIGADDNYEKEEGKNKSVISRWARRKVASQFEDEYLDGRKSFIFSWYKRHREIHEEAMLHYFDPSKNGKKFEYQPKQKTDNCNEGGGSKVNAEQEEEPIGSEMGVANESPQHGRNGEEIHRTEASNLRKSQGQNSYGAVNPHYPVGNERQGEWEPSETHVPDLRERGSNEHRPIRFSAKGNGGNSLHTPWWRNMCCC